MGMKNQLPPDLLAALRHPDVQLDGEADVMKEEVSQQGFDRIVESITNPAPPSEKLRKVMRLVPAGARWDRRIVR